MRIPRVIGAVLSLALIVAGQGCGATSTRSSYATPTGPSATSAPVTASVVSTSSSVTLPSATAVVSSTTLPAGVSICAPSVATELLATSRRWATDSGYTNFRFMTVVEARCGGQFAMAGVACEFIDHPDWACQRVGFIYQRAQPPGWTIISTGDIDCSAMSGVVADACAALGRKV